MSTGSESKQSEPALAALRPRVKSRSEPATAMESSVDLFIVFDEENANCQVTTDGRLRDASETSLQEKEHNYYKVLFESTVDGIVIVDAETMRIVLANETVAGLYGYNSADDMIGVNPLSFVHPDDKDRVLRIITQDMIQNNLRLIHRFRAIGRDGKSMWIRAVGTRTEYRGRLAGLISIRDITEHKREVEERQAAEQRVEFATRLASVGELAAGVAHELNDPLSAISAYIQALANKKELSEAMKDVLEAIYREAQRATSITDNLLALASRHKPAKSLISINEVLESALGLYTRRMESNDIAVEVDLERELPLTMADFRQMQLVFVNIIQNAESAIAEATGRGILHVKTRKTGEIIRISFTDNGPGIAESHITKVFDPFFTTKGSGKGTGLGLTVCYGLVEGHGGHIYVSSSPGEGTTLVVEIPVIAADTPVTGEELSMPAEVLDRIQNRHDTEHIDLDFDSPIPETKRHKILRLLNRR